MLHFECPSCKTKCETKPEYAGQQVPCPKCGTSITAPGKSGAAATVPQRTGESSGNWLMYGIVSVIGLVVLIFVIGFFVQSEGGDNPVVVMDTSMGTIKIELNQAKAPISVKNFLRYVDDKHYDGTIFHRVLFDFMIQGGGFGPGHARKTDRFPPIRNEAGNGLSNDRGTIAMARANDPDSASAEFFINVVDNRGKLDRNAGSAGYAVFGKVIDGMDVVDNIRAVRCEMLGEEKAKPVKDVIIKSVRRVETPKAKTP